MRMGLQPGLAGDFFFGKGERIVRGNCLPRFLRRERGRERGTRKRGPGRGTDKNMVEKLAGQVCPQSVSDRIVSWKGST